jgi:membrane-bound inhibitor of C-type lysozyme
MKKVKIELRKITWYSQLLAIVLYVATFVLGFYLGRLYQDAKYSIIQNELLVDDIISAKFACEGDKLVSVDFLKDKARIVTEGKIFVLDRAISASGARYANADESLVFWNKGDTAFMEENGEIILNDCFVVKE